MKTFASLPRVMAAPGAALACALMLAGCSGGAGLSALSLPGLRARGAEPAGAPLSAIPQGVEPLTIAELDAPPPAPGASTAASLDTTTEAQKAAATAAPPAPVAGETDLGRVVVSLGDVTAPGFWLRSPLVSAPRAGRVLTPAGATVKVELQPGSGAAQMSLAAFRALNLGLTDLPEVTVLAE